MRRSTLIGIGAAAAIGVTGVVLLRPNGSSAPPADPPITVSIGNVVVSVAGVGKAVEARSSQFTATTARGGGSAAGSGAGGSASGQGANVTTPVGAVYPGTSGELVRYLVAAGRPVQVGQPLALIDDHGVASGAARQARNDLRTAQVELRQKRTSDPSKGLPPARAELAAARLAVTSARARLSQVLSPPRPAEVSAARADLAKAQADLEALFGGTPASIARDRELARANVRLAQQKLDRVVAPASAVDVNAARADLAKAEADLDALRNASTGPPSASALAAAEQAVDSARQKLAQLLAPPNPADVTAAQLELDRARADLANLEAGPKPAALAAAREAVSAAQRKLTQLTGPPLPAEVKLARSDVGRAIADLAVLQRRGGPGSPSDLKLAQLKVDAARIRLDTALTAQKLLTVRATANGRVTSLLSAPGSPVDPLTPVAAITDLSRLAVSADMTEFDIASVKPGLRAVVTVDALGGESFAGNVAAAAATGNDSGGVVTFPVRVALNEAPGLKPGMTANVRIIVAQRKKVVRIPLDAVTDDKDGNSVVTVVEPGGKRSTRQVELGLANNKDVEIVKGLRAGEQIAGPAPEPSQAEAP